MTRIICFIVFLLSMAIPCRAQLPLDQQKYADSLNRILQYATSDSIKARTNFHLISFWLSKDPVKAKQYLEEGRRLSKKYPFLEAISFAQEGYFYYATDPEKSEAAYRKADSMLSKFTTKEAYIARSNLWANCASIQQRKDDDKAFINMILNKAIPLAKQAGDSAMMGSQYVAVGVAFMNIEQYDKAEIYLNNAIRILKNAHTQPSRLVAAYNRAGENYILLKKYPDAKQVLDSIKAILAPYPKSELYTGYYLVEGMYYHQLKEYENALTSFDKGIAAADGPNKVYRIQEIRFYEIKTLIALNKFEKAKQVLLTLSADEELMSQDDSRLEIYSGWAETYAGLGQMNAAYNWQKRYSQLSDSLHNSQLSNDVNELEIKYQNAEKQKEIVTLKAKNDQAILSAKNNRLLSWLLASASLFLLIVSAFALMYYRNNKRLWVQKELNHQQQLKEIEQQQQIQYGQALLQGEEQERRRLARDLHDGLGGMLAGVKINLSGLETNITSMGLDNDLQKVIGQLDNSVTELRRIAHNMMPVALIKFGLQTALKDLCESMISETTHIDFQPFDIGENIPEQTQITIYRIVQELLTNAIRHGQASNIVLQCSQNKNTFFITHEDDGKGFDKKILDTEKGMGLNNIKSRVSFLKGKMEIESEASKGTIINIELHVG